MNNKKYKEIYDHKIPMDLEMEWSIVEQKLDKSKKRRPIILFFRGFMFVMLLLPFGYLLLSNDPISSDSILSTMTTNAEGINEEASHPNEKVLINDLPESKIELSLNKKENQGSSVSDSPFIKASQKGVNDYTKKIIVETPPSNDGAKVEPIDLQIFGSSTNDLDNDTKEFFKNESHKTIDQLSSLKRISGNISFNSSKYQISKPYIDIDTKEKIEPKHYVNLTTMVGFGSRSSSIENSNKAYVDLRQSTEKVLESYKFRLGYEYKLNSNWALSTGIDFGSIVEHMQYKDVIERKGNSSNQVVGTYTDYSGKVESLKGNQDYFLVYDVEVSSYNNINSVSIPLSVIYSIQSNKLVWNLSTGIDKPIYTSYKGKLIDESKLPLNFKEIYNSKIFNSLRVHHGVTIDFSFSKHISLGAGLLVEYDLKDRIRVNDISHSYGSLFGSLGLKYSL